MQSGNLQPQSSLRSNFSGSIEKGLPYGKALSLSHSLVEHGCRPSRLVDIVWFEDDFQSLAVFTRLLS
jgi:hypothetical protein